MGGHGKTRRLRAVDDDCGGSALLLILLVALILICVALGRTP